jgi:FtsP/CotA-like multicopper oxidase with cupredoxin domain
MLNRREFLAVTGASAIGTALPTLPVIFHNETGDSHPLHLHRHDFEIVNIGGKASAGVMKDIVNVPVSAMPKLISSRIIPDCRCSIATCNCTWISDSRHWLSTRSGVPIW